MKHQNNILDFMLKIFPKITQEVSDWDSFDLVKLLDRILEIVILNFNASACSLFLEKEDDKDEFVCVAGKGYANQIEGKLYNIREARFTSFVLRERKSFNIKSKEELIAFKKVNNLNEKGKLDDIMWSGERDFENLVCVPLMIKDRPVGLIKVENKKNAKAFSDIEENTLKVTGHLITLSISHARFYQKWRRSHQLEKIIEIIPDLLSYEKEPLLKKIMTLTMEYFNAEVCFIFLRKEEDENYLYCAEGAGYAAEVKDKQEVVYKLDSWDGITGTIADSKQTFIINSIDELKEWRKKGIAKSKADVHLKERGQFRNMIGAPLIARNKVVGVIKVENKKFNEKFSAYDAKALKIISDVAGITLDSLSYRGGDEFDKSEESNYDRLLKIKNHIKQGNIEKAINESIELSIELNYKETESLLTIQSFRYKQWKKQQYVVGFKENQSILTQIGFSVLSILEEIEVELKGVPKKTPNKK